MNPHMNEDVMWQRLQDVQREAENRRLYGRGPSLVGLLASLGLGLARSLAGTPSRLVRSEPWLDADPEASNRVA